MNHHISTSYFRQYRSQLGFSNQRDTKVFFSATDIPPEIDLNYVIELNGRIFSIVDRLNGIVVDDLKMDNLGDFRSKYIDSPFQIIRDNNILPNLNNQGRRPESVYYSWMRGYVFSSYFTKALSDIFSVNVSNIVSIGDDDLKNPDTFKRTPKSDLEIDMADRGSVRIEVQTGFKGINDIKKHKVDEAKRVYYEHQIPTEVVHFDLFNGQVAFVPINEIEDNGLHWVNRPQLEGQLVFSIDQNYFLWKLTESPVKYEDIQQQRQ